MSNISDELLLNELGEITRVFDLVIARVEKRKPFDDIPKAFTLGNGHVKFFFDKCQYIWIRFNELHCEYFLRNGKHYSRDRFKEVCSKVKMIPLGLFNNWKPSELEQNKVRLRILERSKAYKRTHHYCGEEIISWNEFLKLESFLN